MLERLQIAVFLTGLFREHMQGILKTYQDARDQARNGGGVVSATAWRVETLKVLMYNGLIQHMVAYAEKVCPEALARCQEIAGFLAGSDITASLTHSAPYYGCTVGVSDHLRWVCARKEHARSMGYR